MGSSPTASAIKSREIPCFYYIEVILPLIPHYLLLNAIIFIKTIFIELSPFLFPKRNTP
ncbi:hypothetical protein Y592_07775 [Thermosipho sp. 1070]|nr:hypothetical protein Y592_07775 [Thermosipho sp. 1070]